MSPRQRAARASNQNNVCKMVPMPFEWITNWAFITFTRFSCCSILFFFYGIPTQNGKCLYFVDFYSICSVRFFYWWTCDFILIVKEFLFDFILMLFFFILNFVMLPFSRWCGLQVHMVCAWHRWKWQEPAIQIRIRVCFPNSCVSVNIYFFQNRNVYNT